MRWRSIGSGWGTAVFAALFVVFVAALPASAQTPPTTAGESYPPIAVTNLVNPVGCDPSSISGTVTDVLPGSSVTVELLLPSPTVGRSVLRQVALSSTTAIAGSDGRASYTIAVPPNQFGAAIVRATGTNSGNQPFTIDSPVTLAGCPTGTLPHTGNADLTPWLRAAASALVLGGLLLVIGLRRRGAGGASAS